MAHLTRIWLGAAFVLGGAFAASAATKPSRAAHIDQASVFDYPSNYGRGLFTYQGGYPPSGGGAYSNACPPVPPCRRPRDDW